MPPAFREPRTFSCCPPCVLPHASISRGRGQHDAEHAAAMHLRLDFDAPAVGFDRPPGNGQAEAGAPAAPRPRAVGAVEPLEDVGQVFRRDPGPLSATSRTASVAALRTTISMAAPSGPCLIALSIRLSTAWRSVTRSATTVHFGAGDDANLLALLLGEHVEVVGHLPRQAGEADARPAGTRPVPRRPARAAAGCPPSPSAVRSPRESSRSSRGSPPRCGVRAGRPRRRCGWR